jgi:alkylhydroperoxidase/carboxymuconolactone decarboxylase family protein YurZ
MSERDGEQGEAWEYAHGYYRDKDAMRSFELLERYAPGVSEAYIGLRREAFRTERDSSLPDRVRELVIIAIECALMRTSPPPVMHARLAVDAGASVEEIAEVVALCIPIAGMLTYQESGKHVIAAAEAYVRERDADSA